VPPSLYAHRLGRAYGPDSSAAALTRALERPLDGFETDCCLSADGELVLLHDPLLTAARASQNSSAAWFRYALCGITLGEASEEVRAWS
jgi:glycerophosphoryl diester phosphodiesterase